MILLSQDFFHYLLLRCGLSFEVGSAGSDDHSAYDYSVLRTASRIAEHQVVLSQSTALAVVSLLACPRILFSLPFFKAGATCVISPLTWDHFQSSSLLSIFFPWPFKTCIRPSYISVLSHIGGGIKRNVKKYIRGSKSDF